jgi:hypothetical protein
MRARIIGLTMLSAALNAVRRGLNSLAGKVERLERSVDRLVYDSRMEAARHVFDAAKSDEHFPGPPPAHWLEHAQPQPPEHWLALVREKAPQLLDSNGGEVFRVGMPSVIPPPPELRQHRTSSAGHVEIARKQEKPRSQEPPLARAAPLRLQRADALDVPTHRTEPAPAPKRPIKTAKLDVEPTLKFTESPHPPTPVASLTGRGGVKSAGELGQVSRRQRLKSLSVQKTSPLKWTAGRRISPFDGMGFNRRDKGERSRPEIPITVAQPNVAPEVPSSITPIESAPVLKQSPTVQREGVTLLPERDWWPSLPDDLSAAEEHESVQRAMQAWKHLQHLEHEQRGLPWSE